MIEKPDIVTIIQNEGFELKSKGRSLWTQCPLHSERTPSFKVDPAKQLFYCFGCHEHGDSIDFIQRYKGLSFKDALAYLGINGTPSKKAVYQALRDKRKRELIKQFREWSADYYDDLCSLYRTLQKAKEKAQTIEEVEALAEFYHQEPVWIHRMEVLQGSDDMKKLELYREVRNGE